MKELEVVKYRQVQGLSVFINVLKYRNPHFHQEWELLWVLEGTLLISINYKRERVEKDQLYLIPPSVVHEFHIGTSSCVFLCLQMSPEFVNLSENTVIDEYLVSDMLNESDVRKVKRAILNTSLSYFSHKQLSALSCAGECNSLMYRILRTVPFRNLTAEEAATRRKTDGRLGRLMEFVDNNYMKKILLRDFAEHEGLSMEYLSHFIKDALSLSFQDYVSSVRVQMAAKMISTRDLKLTEISRLAGFSDYKYFIKNFRKHFGMSPDEFSKQLTSDSGENSGKDIENSITDITNYIANSRADEKILSDLESMKIISSLVLSFK